MLHYPKIPGAKNAPSGRCVAFDKLDGTNLHWCWDRDFGWHALGTRRDEFNLTPDGVAAFDAAHPGLEDAAGLFLARLADDLERVFRDNPTYAGVRAVTVFAEYVGPNSFAGVHKPDDPKDLVLFDVTLGDSGLVGPRQFVADFGHLRIPRVVYEGKLTGAFMEAVREGKYGVAEGVVCKGGTGGADVWMVKVKTYAYLERLKRSFGERWRDYWE
jgi:hypothetical protein